MTAIETTSNPELVRRLSRLVRLAAEQPSSMPEQRALVKEIVAAAKAGAARIAPGPEGALLVDEAPLADADDDARLLAERLAAYGVEELTITPRAAAADLFDLGRLLGASPTGDDPVSRFAAGATVIDSRSIQRRMKERAPVVDPAVADGSPGAPPRRASRIDTPRSSAALRAASRTPVGARAGTPTGTPIVAGAPPEPDPEKLSEPPPVPDATNPDLAAILRKLSGTLELVDLRRAINELVAFADLAFRTGRTDDLIEAMGGLIALEWSQLERDSADERRQAFAHGVRRLAKPVLLRRLAMLRHQRAADAVAVARLQAVLHRYGTDGTDGTDALIDEYASAPTAAARRTCLDALRGLRATYDSLFALARGVEPSEVRLAASVLGELGEAQAEEPLLALLRHEDARVRRDVVAALARSPGAAALDALGTALGDESAMVRARAVAGLIARKDPRGVPLLAPLLDQEPDREVLYAALEGLGALGGPEAVQLLIRCANGEAGHPLHRSAEYRVHACNALVTIRTPQAMACVQMLRDDRDREVRDASVRLVAQARRRSTSASIPVVSGP